MLVEGGGKACTPNDDDDEDEIQLILLDVVQRKMRRERMGKYLIFRVATKDFPGDVVKQFGA